MKQKISISLDEGKIALIDKLLKNNRFRNRSHILEYSLDKLLEAEKNNGKNL